MAKPAGAKLGTLGAASNLARWLVSQGDNSALGDRQPQDTPGGIDPEFASSESRGAEYEVGCSYGVASDVHGAATPLFEGADRLEPSARLQNRNRARASPKCYEVKLVNYVVVENDDTAGHDILACRFSIPRSEHGAETAWSSSRL